MAGDNLLQMDYHTNSSQFENSGNFTKSEELLGVSGSYHKCQPVYLNQSKSDMEFSLSSYEPLDWSNYSFHMARYYNKL